MAAVAVAMVVGRSSRTLFMGLWGFTAALDVVMVAVVGMTVMAAATTATPDDGASVLRARGGMMLLTAALAGWQVWALIQRLDRWVHRLCRSTVGLLDALVSARRGRDALARLTQFLGWCNGHQVIFKLCVGVKDNLRVLVENETTVRDGRRTLQF
jgi:hypothetical protein